MSVSDRDRNTGSSAAATRRSPIARGTSTLLHGRRPHHHGPPVEAHGNTRTCRYYSGCELVTEAASVDVMREGRRGLASLVLV